MVRYSPIGAVGAILISMVTTSAAEYTASLTNPVPLSTYCQWAGAKMNSSEISVECTALNQKTGVGYLDVNKCVAIYDDNLAKAENGNAFESGGPCDFNSTSDPCECAFGVIKGKGSEINCKKFGTIDMDTVVSFNGIYPYCDGAIGSEVVSGLLE